jgi:hypothetical protein
VVHRCTGRSTELRVEWDEPNKRHERGVGVGGLRRQKYRPCRTRGHSCCQVHRTATPCHHAFYRWRFRFDCPGCVGGGKAPRIHNLDGSDISSSQLWQLNPRQTTLCYLPIRWCQRAVLDAAVKSKTVKRLYHEEKWPTNPQFLTSKPRRVHSRRLSRITGSLLSSFINYRSWIFPATCRSQQYAVVAELCFSKSG